MALTEDAKKEIREAIRIVREDRFEQHARGILGTLRPKEETPKPKDELIDDDDKPKVDPPPAKEKKVEDPEQPKRHSAYWGEVFDD